MRVHLKRDLIGAKSVDLETDGARMVLDQRGKKSSSNKKKTEQQRRETEGAELDDEAKEIEIEEEEGKKEFGRENP